MTRRDAAAPTLAALASFVAYTATLAPSVTLEDSGELITAAARLGVAHAPGYPLYTLLGHVATWLPAGTVAWRVNLLSAFCMAAATGVFAAALQRLVRDALGLDRGAGVLALAGALLAAFAWETWEQAVIAEVYALHLLLFAATFLMLVRWILEPEQRGRTLALLGLALGLAVAHHPAALMWVPAALACVLTTAPREAFAPAALGRAAGAFALGLLPLAYLPLASARDPVLDWGDPDSFGRFFDVVTRAQYGTSPADSAGEAFAQAALLGRLILEQWPPVLLMLLAPGVYALARLGKAWLAPVAALWLCTGPLMALLSNFSVAGGEPAVAAENAALASVFFIPSHWTLAALVTAGLALGARAAPGWVARVVLAAALMLPLATAARHWPRVDLSGDRVAEAYVASLFEGAAPASLLLVQWDPFHFPTLYFQHVEGWRPDLTVVNTNLLRRSWYVRQLSRQHAGELSGAAAEMEAFVEAVMPFERGRAYEGQFIEGRYRAMIRALIESSRARGREVYATYVPDPDLAPGLVAEPLYVAWRLRAPAAPPATTGAPARLRELLTPSNNRMAPYLRDHVAALMFERAALEPASALAPGEGVVEREVPHR